MKNIAIFASGEGTNAQNIINYFKTSSKVNVKLVLANKAKANVLNRAKKENIPTFLINKEELYNSNIVIEQLTQSKVDLIVLAGFLWLIPESLIKAFQNKIINIHPALLPKYGGEGMYGMNVHKAVINAKETESGITIHYVNNNYDEGKIISQHYCEIIDTDTPEILANKIHQLEQVHFPKTIETIL
jgi:phosphoribosylglycinamide formyltransferase-1